MAKRKPARSWPPKGSYPHPAGGYIHHGPTRLGQKIRVVTHLKAEPDVEKLAKALIELAEHINEQERRDNESDS